MAVPQQENDLNLPLASKVAEQALSQGGHLERQSGILNPLEYVPALLASVSSAAQWGTSRVVVHRHGIGLNEWWIMVVLANRPGVSQVMLSKQMAMNSSIASRSVQALKERELVTAVRGTGATQHLFLTDAGIEVYEDLYPLAIQRQEILLEQLNVDEVAQLRKLLQRLRDAIPAMQAFDEKNVSEEPRYTKERK